MGYVRVKLEDSLIVQTPWVDRKDGIARIDHSMELPVLANPKDKKLEIEVMDRGRRHYKVFTSDKTIGKAKVYLNDIHPYKEKKETLWRDDSTQGTLVLRATY